MLSLILSALALGFAVSALLKGQENGRRISDLEAPKSPRTKADE